MQDYGQDRLAETLTDSVVSNPFFFFFLSLLCNQSQNKAHCRIEKEQTLLFAHVLMLKTQ